MAIEVGMILEGKVSGITKFGAFVDLPDSKTGMALCFCDSVFEVCQSVFSAVAVLSGEPVSLTD